MEIFAAYVVESAAAASDGGRGILPRMDRTRLTAALKPLERPGLVTVAADPEDRRSRWMTLTPNGGTRLAKAVPIWERTQQEIEGLVPNGDPNRLRSNLSALSKG
jgi:DNA-binding MarR family transcriptional regulator